MTNVNVVQGLSRITVPGRFAKVCFCCAANSVHGTMVCRQNNVNMNKLAESNHSTEADKEPDMFGRFRLRKDILVSIVLVVLFGIGVYYLQLHISRIPALVESVFITWAFRFLVVIYILLILVTLRYTLSTYDLERFDPGSRASLKRLLRRMRYRLPRGPLPVNLVMRQFEHRLMRAGYQVEYEDSISGKVYYRSRSTGLLGRSQTDRIMIKKHDALNVLLVDQMLQDCIRFIRSLRSQPSKRNVLLIVTETPDPYDAASAAAGIVNFLGKFRDGTLGPILLVSRHNRLFYPADRTILPRSHRFFQYKIRHFLFHLIRVGKRSYNQKAAVSSDPKSGKLE